MSSCRMLCGCSRGGGEGEAWLEKREGGTKKASSFCRTEKWTERLAEKVGICVLLPKGSWRGKDGGTVRRGLSVPVLPETAQWSVNHGSEPHAAL